MSTAITHFENASFLRELAENLPHLHPATHRPEQAKLLQRLADEELAEAQYVEWVQTKIAAARADTLPTLTTSEVMARLKARSERFRNAV